MRVDIVGGKDFQEVDVPFLLKNYIRCKCLWNYYQSEIKELCSHCMEIVLFLENIVNILHNKYVLRLNKYIFGFPIQDR